MIERMSWSRSAYNRPTKCSRIMCNFKGDRNLNIP